MKLDGTCSSCVGKLDMGLLFCVLIVALFQSEMLHVAGYPHPRRTMTAVTALESEFELAVVRLIMVSERFIVIISMCIYALSQAVDPAEAPLLLGRVCHQMLVSS